MDVMKAKQAWPIIAKLLGLEGETNIKRCVITVDVGSLPVVELTQYKELEEVSESFNLIPVGTSDE